MDDCEMDDVADTQDARASCECVEILPCRMHDGNDTHVAVVWNTTPEQVLRAGCQNFRHLECTAVQHKCSVRSASTISVLHLLIWICETLTSHEACLMDL